MGLRAAAKACLGMALACGWGAAAPAQRTPGLLIVGGGLSPDNAAIYGLLRDRARQETIAVIPSASAEPAASIAAFRAAFAKHGGDPARVVAVRLAMRDDPASPENEAAWSGNARDAIEIGRIRAASVIWFTGGDQGRTLALLTDRQGRDTPMLAAIRARLRAGALLGGTSAGAAIMGSEMIACGDPRAAARQPVSRDPGACAAEEGQPEPLVLTRGLGFLPRSVVDQHFSERGRLPRLARAVACRASAIRFGLGIDEDTAALIVLRARTIAVVGSGTATLVRPESRRDRCATGEPAAPGIERLAPGARRTLP